MKAALSPRLRRASYLLGLLKRTMALVWQASRWWTVAWIALIMLQGVLPAAVVYTTKWVVDAIAGAVGAGVGDPLDALRPLLPPAVIMATLLLLQQLLSGVQNLIRTHQSALVQDHTKNLIHNKAAEVDFAFYESSDYYDQLEQANSQTAGPVSLLSGFGVLVQSLITFLSMAAILITYAWWLPLVLLVSTTPAFAVVVYHRRILHEWWKDTTEIRRLNRYYDMVLTAQRSAAEVRAYRTGDFFRDLYQVLSERLRNENLMLQRKHMFRRLSTGALSLAVMGATMAWIAWRAVVGQATLGDLALFYQAFNQGQSLMSSVLNNVGKIYADVLLIEHLFAFLDQKKELHDPPTPVAFPQEIKQGIRLSNITFAYPGTDRPVLKNFSLDIPAGKTIAIVGENGAGKSTFIKLLCRFYDPNAGSVSVDGIDVREFRQEELRRNISVMFQFPVEYQLTARQNIVIGDLGKKASQAEIEAAATGAGAHDTVMKLPKTYDTQLGRMFANGAELSGGEWQRIALARAFLRDGQVLLLDEPTSFMDSWAELDWMKRFKNLAAGRTAVIITHRFTTAMKADLIYVMDAGEVVESGSHADLVQQGGRYAASWHAQMQTGDGAAAAAAAALPEWSRIFSI